MRLQTTTAIVLVAVVVCLPCQSSAQGLHYFLTGGTHSEGYSHYAGFSTGAVHDLFHSWISVGGEGDVFFSQGYAAGRGGPIAQLNLLRDRPLRPFAIGGYKWGEGNGTVAGGGVEYRPGKGIGFRASVEDIFRTSGGIPCGVNPFPPCNLLPHGGSSFTRHGMSFQFGLAFR